MGCSDWEGSKEVLMWVGALVLFWAWSLEVTVYLWKSNEV